MTPTLFKTMFPEFASEDDQRVDMYITLAIPHFEPGRWGALYESGVAYYVAHQMALANGRESGGATVASSAGVATMEKVGDVQVQRSDAVLIKTLENPFMATAYGQEYIRLRSLISTGGLAL